ncbi:hypothetical protein D3C84_870460 [compost metagenome]
MAVFGEVTGHGQPAGPAETPIGRLVQDAPGFFRAEGAVHVVAIDQPQLQVGLRKLTGDQLRITEQLTQCLLQVERCTHGALTNCSWPSVWVVGWLISCDGRCRIN